MANPKKFSFLLLAIIAPLAGCVPSVDEINTSNKDQVCARSCSTTYSQCVATALAPANFTACKEGLKMCVNTCPSLPK